MIGAFKAISQRSRGRAYKFGSWLAGAAVALALAATPQAANARDHDGGGHRGGGHAYSGRGDGGRHFSGGEQRGFSGRSFGGQNWGSRNSGERRFGSRDFGNRNFAERGREFRARDFGGRHFEGRHFDGHRFEGRHFDGRRFDGGRSIYSRPYRGYGYGGWRGYRSWAPRYFIGFGSYYDDYLAWPYYGLAAWEMAEYAALTEAQVRAQEDAMIAATTAPLNDPIEWNDANASGSVTPLRDGQTEDGRTCREFQQQIIVDGKRERAYGTACREPDGSWQMMEE